METYQTIGAETTVLENDATLEDLLCCRCEGRKKESEFTYKKREISSDHFVDYPKNDKVYEREPDDGSGARERALGTRYTQTRRSHLKQRR